jgi:large subunit ribosomal protein L25
MAKKTSLKAAPRARTGSGLLKQMRREGWIPSVIYGRNVESHNLKVDSATFREVLAHSTSENILINLDIEGEGTRLAFLKSVQHHPITGAPLHVDFLAIDEKTSITAQIPVIFHGEALGVKAGGLVEQFLHTVEISCLPNDLPGELDVDISHLNLGDALHIGDVKYPEGVKPTGSADIVIAHITKPAAAVSEEAAAGSEEAAAV